jgi:hypothetical protein
MGDNPAGAVLTVPEKVHSFWRNSSCFKEMERPFHVERRR